jgi:predicted enzyme related to lactoylglutathione lyase
MEAGELRLAIPHSENCEAQSGCFLAGSELERSSSVMDSHGRFLWYELMTSDTKSAKAFYSRVMGWQSRDVPTPGMSYTLFTVGEETVCGLTNLRKEAGQDNAVPKWIGYVGVSDVDAAADQVRRLSGTVYVPPTNVPDFSRFSVVADPQQATFVLFKLLSPGQGTPADSSAKGRVGWHELLADNWEPVFPFYAALFGWQRADADSEAMSTYQQFSAGGQTIGGMYTKPASVSVPFWLYYFNTDDVDAAAKRVTAGGGRILEGPIGVPGASRVARCVDPQGAMFALVGKRGSKAVGYFGQAATDDPAARRFYVPKKT